MSTTNDGGPAFPRIEHSDIAGNHFSGATGMSLRDWFAGQALAGLLGSELRTIAPVAVTKDAYRYADAMLAARTPEASQ